MAFNYLRHVNALALYHPEKAVLWVLCDHVNQKQGTGEWTLSLPIIAREAGYISERHAWSGVQQLIALRLADKVGRKFSGPITYRVNLEQVKAFPTLQQVQDSANLATGARMACIYCQLGLAHIARMSCISCKLNRGCTGNVNQECNQTLRTGEVRNAEDNVYFKRERRVNTVTGQMEQVQVCVDKDSIPVPAPTPAPHKKILDGSDVPTFDFATFAEEVETKDGVYPAKRVREILDFWLDSRKDYWRNPAPDKGNIVSVDRLRDAIGEMSKKVPKAYVALSKRTKTTTSSAPAQPVDSFTAKMMERAKDPFGKLKERQ